MFIGEEHTIRFRFANHLIGAVIDHFGRDTMIISSDDEHFTISVEVAASPKFYAWLYGFGTGVEVLSPASARLEVKESFVELAQLY